MILALKYTKKIKLNLVGNYDRDNLKKEIKQNLLWKKVNEFGFLNRKNSDKILKNSIAGLVVFLPEPNHVSAQPNKLFEYMNAGLPVIASNFPLWREVIEGNNCGICVDPNNPRAIGNAIQYLFENKNQAKQMGKNGLEAIKKKYNWRTEEKKLLKLYTNI